MKRILTSILVAVGITGPLAIHSAAQSNPQVADIPFTFNVGERTLPAGKYQVAKLSGTSTVFQLLDGRGHGAFAMLAVRSDGKPENPSLTFACYGNECVLAKITPSESAMAYGIDAGSVQKYVHHSLGMASLVSIKLAPR